MAHELKAASGKTKYLMVMLHGVGSNGADLFSIAPFMARKLTDVTFFSPDGIEPYDMAHFGYQWFSLTDRTPEVMVEKLAKNAPKITKAILAKAAELKVPTGNIILFGFSQGTMTSIYLSLEHNQPFHSVLGFSGALIKPKQINNNKTPICLIHGQRDDVVSYDNMALAKDKLEEMGVDIMTHGIKNLTHSIDMEGIETAMKFLKERMK